jgi:hypothetical protein
MIAAAARACSNTGGVREPNTDDRLHFLGADVLNRPFNSCGRLELDIDHSLNRGGHSVVALGGGF